MTTTMLQEVVSITEDYLGPAAERFVSRQVTFHLNKHPEELSKADIPKLAEWVKVSLALLTQDKKMVDEFDKRIRELAN